MDDHTLTGAKLAALGATDEQIVDMGPTLARVCSERADAAIMAAKYDAVCERFADLYREVVILRRQVGILEGQLHDRDARIAELKAKLHTEETDRG
ncbi:hypothetical protein [Nocardiopsis sp. JB363]|uniref:hypothetical protein n=1 Tax=Nocardiopsis sp. JB363 TaxID=1434837 RepID=UPI00097A0D26|nr:hypothetical protein [Nocardiopsis sp. JB363]SIO86954.1 hypothetical protein BQ8420_14445 [Nocardiopsis sp. JB363]